MPDADSLARDKRVIRVRLRAWRRGLADDGAGRGGRRGRRVVQVEDRAECRVRALDDRRGHGQGP